MCSAENRLRYKVNKYREINAKLKDFTEALNENSVGIVPSKSKIILLVGKTDQNYNKYQKSLSELKVNYSMYNVSTFDSAIKFLEGEFPYVKLPAPDVIMIDGSMGDDAEKLVEFIKQSDYLKNMPVILCGNNNQANSVENNNYFKCEFRNCGFKELTDALFQFDRFYYTIAEI